MNARVRELLVALDGLVANPRMPAFALINAFCNRWGSLAGTSFFLDLLNSGVVEVCPSGHVHLTMMGSNLREWLERGGLDDVDGLEGLPVVFVAGGRA